MALYELTDLESKGMLFAGPADDVSKLVENLAMDTDHSEYLQPLGETAIATEVSVQSE